jgi:hypothetical protein
VKTLEAYLLDSAHDGVTSHTVSVHRGSHGEVHMRIYPPSIRGADLQFEVRGDTVVPVDLGIVAAEVDRIAPWLDPHRHAGR